MKVIIGKRRETEWEKLERKTNRERLLGNKGLQKGKRLGDGVTS